MEESEINLLNACTDLVTQHKNEGFPSNLLSLGPGEWVGVREFCQQNGVTAGELSDSVFAAWLPDPRGDDAYAVVLFYDDESEWSLSAHYNRARLANGTSSRQSPRNQPAAHPVSSPGRVNPVPDATQ